jgi:hypothetical protein
MLADKIWAPSNCMGNLVRRSIVLFTAAMSLILANCATNTPSLSDELEGLVGNEVRRLIADDFPELASVKIEYGPVLTETDTVFFETYVKTSTGLRRPARRTYQIFANERLVSERPDNGAIRAIIVHELIHIRDYAGKSIWQLLKLKKNMEDANYRRQYERYTDQRTLQLGYGDGLIRYRNWLYRVIKDPVKIADKKRIYMTPEEINLWSLQHQPEKLSQRPRR